MVRVCEMFLFCLGSGALRLGTEPADGGRNFTLTIDVKGAPLDKWSIMATTKSGSVLADMVRTNPARILARAEGEEINVGFPPYYDECSYVVGQKKTTCVLKEWRVVFTSEEEVEETLMAMISLTRNGVGNEPPFEVKIDGAVKWMEYGPIDPQFSFWRMTEVAGPGVVVTVLFQSTNAVCTYTVAKTTEQKIIKIDGWTAEFETMVSRKFTGDYTEVLSRTTNKNGWKVHLIIEGTGPQVDIYLNSVIVRTVEPLESGVLPILFDAEIGQNVKFVIPNGVDQIADISFTVGDGKQFFENFEGYKVTAETLPNNSTTRSSYR